MSRSEDTSWDNEVGLAASKAQGARESRHLRLLFRVLLLTLVHCGFASVAGAADVHVMKTGLGDGLITGTGISCGVMGATESTACSSLGLPGGSMVTLSVTVGVGSEFTSWGGDCASVSVVPPATPACTVAADVVRRVRANFAPTTAVALLPDFTPEAIDTFLDDHPEIDTPGEFVAALPPEFRQNWILMPRSESL